jgi:hypothetical protein
LFRIFVFDWFLFFAATWAKSNCSFKPLLATTLSSLQERGKAALKHFTEGQVTPLFTLLFARFILNPAQFSECATVFRSVLQQLLLVVADEPGDADACKELLAQSRDYLIAVRFPSHPPLVADHSEQSRVLLAACRSSSRPRGEPLKKTGARRRYLTGKSEFDGFGQP